MRSRELLDSALEYLRVGLWHTTSHERFVGIKKAGKILVEPDLPKGSRWKDQCESYYPYVRKIGGVSLFFLRDFDPDEYSKACPMSSWYEFIPFQPNLGTSVWIQMKTERLNGKIALPAELSERQDREEAWRHTLMPRIEAAHIGDISVDDCARAIEISDQGIRGISLID